MVQKGKKVMPRAFNHARTHMVVPAKFSWGHKEKRYAGRSGRDFIMSSPISIPNALSSLLHTAFVV